MSNHTMLDLQHLAKSTRPVRAAGRARSIEFSDTLGFQMVMWQGALGDPGVLGLRFGLELRDLWHLGALQRPPPPNFPAFARKAELFRVPPPVPAMQPTDQWERAVLDLLDGVGET